MALRKIHKAICCMVLTFIVAFIGKSATGPVVKVVVISKSEDFFAKVRTSHIIYDIQCVVDLESQAIQIPSNCVLRFSAGMIKNGTLIGDGTFVENPSNLVIFDQIDIPDKAYQFINESIYVDWFSGKSDADKIQAAFDFAEKNRTPVSFLSREYVLDHTVTISMGNIVMKGTGGGGEYCDMGTKIVSSATFTSSYEKNPLFYVRGEPKKRGATMGVISGRITGITFSTSRRHDVFHFYLASGPSRPLFIDHCSFLNCGTALRILDNGVSSSLGFLYVENCTMVGNKWNIVAHGRHSLMGLYFCKNVAEQCDGNINLGYSENYSTKPYESPAPKAEDFAASANIVISDNLLEGTVDCIYINGGKCVVNIERNYFETSRKQFVILSFSNPNSVVTFENNYISEKKDVFLQLRNCQYSLQKNYAASSLKTTNATSMQ